MSDRTGDPDLEDVKRELRSRHLPRLAENGFIEWDPDAETIRRGRNFDEIAPLLESLDGPGDELPEDELPDDWL